MKTVSKRSSQCLVIFLKTNSTETPPKKVVGNACKEMRSLKDANSGMMDATAGMLKKTDRKEVWFYLRNNVSG